jgi:hypothetical protein
MGVDWQRTVIEPIPKLVEAMLHEVFCRSKVEPRVDYRRD